MGQIYHFCARDHSGRNLKGDIEAQSELDLIRKLQNSGYTVTSIQAKKQNASIFDKKISYKDMAFFCRQLSSMTRTGISIIQAIQMIEAQVKNRTLSSILSIVKKDLLNGESLSGAFKKHERSFPALFVNMLYAAEVSGELDRVLSLLADSFQSTHQMQGKIKGALAYPIVIILFAIIVSGALIFYALPTFLTMFENSNTELPIITKILLFVHNGLLDYGKYGLFVFVFIIISMIHFWSNPNIKRYVDRILIKVPYLGSILTQIMVYRFSQSLHDLYQSGIAIDKSLEITAKIINNSYFSEEIYKVCHEIRVGRDFGLAIEQSGIFPSLLVSMIKVGEETGDLDTLLDDVTTYSKNELDMKINQITSLIEPLLIVFVGLFVGSVIVGILLPMYDGMTLINK